MKQLILLAAALVFAGAAISQTAAQKRDLNNDLTRERNKRNEVARDLARGNVREARADNRAAVAAHKEVHRDARNIRYHQARRRHHAVVVHRRPHRVYHRRYHPRHRRVIVHHRRDV